MLLGITTSKEYVELEWPIDILITLVWVSMRWFLRYHRRPGRFPHLRGELVLRRFHHCGCCLLHIITSMEVPISLTKSTP